MASTHAGEPSAAEELLTLDVAHAERDRVRAAAVAYATSRGDAGFTLAECLAELRTTWGGRELGGAGAGAVLDVVSVVATELEADPADVCVDPLTGRPTASWLDAALPDLYRRLARDRGPDMTWLVVRMDDATGIDVALAWQLATARALVTVLPDAEHVIYGARGVFLALVRTATLSPSRLQSLVDELAAAGSSVESKRQPPDEESARRLLARILAR